MPVLIILQKLRRRNLQNVCHFKQRFQTDPANRARALDLRKEVQTDSHLLGKALLRVSALFAVIGDLLCLHESLL